MPQTSRRARNLDALVDSAESDSSGLKRNLGALQLTAIGVAIIVGAGVFVLSGQAAAEFAGPGVAISFVIAGIAAAMAALCYSELISAVPVAGSTYTFVYAALGPLLGFLVGWNLLVEYLLGAATVAVGWSGYFENALGRIDVELPEALAAGPFDGGVVNLPAVVLVALLAVLLLRGTQESARATTVLVAIKMVVLALFIGFGAFYVSSANYEPFIPANQGAFGDFGASGVLRAAAAVFYAYIGFDIVCNAAQEARDPRRTVPRGILGTLGIATVLYVAVALVVTGLAPYTTLDVPDPLSVALNSVSELEWLQSVIDVGTVLFLAATVLATMYGLTRILMRVSEDGMLPALVARVDPRRGTPTATTLIVAVATAAISGLLPISTLADLVSAGTLTAFVFVGISVLALRRSRPDLERSFQLPLGPAIPLATIVVTIAVALMLPGLTLVRLVVWVAVGFLLYWLYARGRAEAVISERIGEAKG
jgi:basic amino acid/polyamine antiporter, APA family